VTCRLQASECKIQELQRENKDLRSLVKRLGKENIELRAWRLPHRREAFRHLLAEVEASLGGRVDRTLISRQLRYYFGIEYKAHLAGGFAGTFASADEVADDNQITKQLSTLSDVQARAALRCSSIFCRHASLRLPCSSRQL
jgi:hypothetical protein